LPQQPIRGEITRGMIAKQLGVSVSTVIRWEGTLLHPKVRPDGVHVFEVAEVAELAKKRAQESGTAGSGDLDADACALFRSGKNVVDAVLALRQPIDRMRAIHRAFVEEERTVLLPPEVAKHIEDQWRGTPMWPVSRDTNLTSTDVLHIFNRLLAHIQDLAARLRTAGNNPIVRPHKPECDEAARRPPTRDEPTTSPSAPSDEPASMNSQEHDIDKPAPKPDASSDREPK
jgi:hypothetical protein